MTVKEFLFLLTGLADRRSMLVDWYHLERSMEYCLDLVHGQASLLYSVPSELLPPAVGGSEIDKEMYCLRSSCLFVE